MTYIPTHLNDSSTPDNLFQAAEKINTNLDEIAATLAEIAPAVAVADTNVAPGAAIRESKILFDHTSGHAHTGVNSKQLDHRSMSYTGTNTHATIDGFIASKGQSSGLSSLGADGKVPDSQLKPQQTFSVVSQSAMFALAAHQGDICMRTDLSLAFRLMGTDPTQLTSWISFPVPSGTVLTVENRTGNVTLGDLFAPIAKGVTNGDSHDHYGGDGSQIDHTTLSNKGTNTHGAIDTHLGAASPHSGHEITSAKGAVNGYCPLGSDQKVPSGNMPAMVIPAGLIFDFAGTVAPSGFLLCDGSAVSRTDYGTLFAAISTTWGVGNGTTTFNIPDFRRRVTVGSGGTGTSTLNNGVGSVGGEENHTLAVTEMPSHNHGGTTGAAGLSQGAGADGVGDYPIGVNTNYYIGGHTHSISSQGSGTAHNTIQPSVVVMKIIKT